MKGGVLNGKVIDVDDVKALANLPSREQLLAQVLGRIAGADRRLCQRAAWHPAQSGLRPGAVRKQKEEAA